ncbi:TPA: hypothetical protein RTG53_000041 [Campylobacter jejuni]|nr:hypothetical protein [Campylobacter jejuni]
MVVITFIAFILPGFLFSLYNDYIFRFDLNNVLVLDAAALIFPLMECIQFLHLYYFNKLLNVFSLHLMFVEFGKVVKIALGRDIT